MGEIPLEYTNQEVINRKKKSPLGLIIIIIIVVVVAGFLILRQSKKTEQNKEAASVTTEPTPTEAPKVDKTTVKIQVQNGTGTPGQASTVVDALKNAGYNSDNIKTANADEYTNEVTTITAKSGFEDTAADIKSSLESTFTEINISSDKLDSTSDFDIVIVTGGKSYTGTPTLTTEPVETTTPNPSDTTTPTETPMPTETLTPTPTI